MECMWNGNSSWTVRKIFIFIIQVKFFFRDFINFKDSNQIPLGRIQINSLKDLTKVGSVLNKDLRDPSLFDLEDLQEQPEGLITSSTSVSSFSSTSALSFSTNVSNNSSKAKIKYTNTNENHSDEIAEIAKSEGSSDENDLNYENDENESTNQTKNESTSNGNLNAF